ncbi:MAG: reverse transcriptase domain-containing protein, partial [Oscillospiraceae bacterium]
ILLRKMWAYGIRGPAHDWFASYLNNRKQYVYLDNIESQMADIKHGVPQGSILGPLLFLLYVNDISNVMPNLKIKLFADDTNLFLYNKNISDLFENANAALKNLGLWFSANKLSLNVEKTNYCIFKKSNFAQTVSYPNLKINNSSITRVSSTKYLGVLLDDLLTFKDHVNSIVAKISTFCGIFFKLRNRLPATFLKTIYFSMIFPHLIYGIEIYANTVISNLNPLMKMNNKILRILQFKPLLYPVVKLYENFDTLQIPKLRDFNIICLVHNVIHNAPELPEIYHNYFTSNLTIYSHNTRGSRDLHMSFSRSNTGKRNIKILGCKLWNQIPKSLKCIKSHPVFKRKIKLFVKNDSS